MQIHEQEKIRTAVRERYAKVVANPLDEQEKRADLAKGCCETTLPQSQASNEGCGCGCGSPRQQQSSNLGYSTEDLNSVPEGANMGLGCGNPIAQVSLKAGERVVDLGSGGGFDCFLAAGKVGANGKVIGVDMTPEMVSKARHNARKANVTNVEFRLGEIEHLPVADNSADLIISNCVINLSTDKGQVFKEAFRVLKPGGRIAVSDIVATKPLPLDIQKDLELISACVGGAATVDETRAMLEDAGFKKIRIDASEESHSAIESCTTNNKAAEWVMSASILAIKP